ncbi:MAG: hypothetical protein KZQ93_21045, partial [Candidatus Thiodiazotropha sp. (ex Monitilora ramsayi)]|nr:hypothetical protein [Candidatus Thiodiazotropha sp. (ex Monitilora ramsayi)]
MTENPQNTQALENPPPSETEPAQAQSTGIAAASAERVTGAPLKNPKKVAAGRAGAAARKAKQERLLEELRAAKESFRAGEASIPLPK